MFLRAELPVLCLDIYENGKLYYDLFFPYDQPRFPSFRLIVLYYIPLSRTSVLPVFAVFILQFISHL